MNKSIITIASSALFISLSGCQLNEQIAQNSIVDIDSHNIQILSGETIAITMGPTIDNDGDLLSYGLKPASNEVSISGNILTFQSNQIGTWSYVITASDGKNVSNANYEFVVKNNSGESTATNNPTTIPTTIPTTEPTSNPTSVPTEQPTSNPTANPTIEPTNNPTNAPTEQPTNNPTANPTTEPTSNPTNAPTEQPTSNATANPTTAPTAEPALEIGSIRVEWQKPLLNADGTSCDDLTGYKIYLANEEGMISNEFRVENANTTSYTIANLDEGNYRISMTSYNQYGKESEIAEYGVYQVIY